MEISLAAEPIFHIGGFEVTNSLLTAWIVVAFLVIVSIALKKKIKKVPKGLQNFVEAMFESFLKIMDSVSGSRKQSIKFFPIVVTIFLFVIFNN